MYIKQIIHTDETMSYSKLLLIVTSVLLKSLAIGIYQKKKKSVWLLVKLLISLTPGVCRWRTISEDLVI